MSFDAVALLNVASTVLAASTAVFVGLGVKNLRRRTHSPTSTPTETADLSEVGADLKQLLRHRVSLELGTRGALPMLKPKRLVEDDRLSQAAADIGVADLEILLRALTSAKRQPPSLVGVNKGGALVANFLAHRLSLHEKHLIKCDYRSDFDKLFCEDRPVLGDIVIIDDVVRTGRTIARVKSHFRAKYPTSAIFTFCLVYVRDPDALHTTPSEVVDYHAWYATSSEISMPWAKRSEVEHTKIFDDLDIDQIVGVSRAALETRPNVDTDPLPSR